MFSFCILQANHVLISIIYYADPCQDDLNPCKNGICTANATTGDYQCRCDIGYEGINCTEEINECLSNPCLNNGTCTVQLFNTVFMLIKHMI